MSNPKVFTAVGSKALAFSGRTRLHRVLVHNSSGGLAYLQLFDAAATDDVTLGTTVPMVSIPCENNATTDVELDYLTANGLVHACTTTATGSTGATMDTVNYING